jgi:uncharacterized protein DUF1918
MMITPASTGELQPGDWIALRAPVGGPPQRGEVVEVMGAERYRVRWDDEHESILRLDHDLAA